MRKATVRENLYGEIIYRLNHIMMMITAIETDERHAEDKPAKRAYKRKAVVTEKKKVGRPKKNK